MKLESRRVLVLNADFNAFTVCTVYKAFLLIYMRKAEVVNHAQDIFIRTVTSSFEVPSVIRLYNYVSLPYKGVLLNRHNIFKRDGHKCVYCGVGHHLTLDHVLPRSRGGASSWQNLVTACKHCNSKKGDRTPEEAGMRLPYKPFKPSFIMYLRDFSGTTDDTWKPYLQKN